MTFVQGRVARSPLRSSTFSDITDLAIVSFVGGVTFDGDLTAEEYAAVWWRLTSKDDEDDVSRRRIADLLASDEAATPLARALALDRLGLGYEVLSD